MLWWLTFLSRGNFFHKLHNEYRNYARRHWARDLPNLTFGWMADYLYSMADSSCDGTLYPCCRTRHQMLDFYYCFHLNTNYIPLLTKYKVEFGYKVSGFYKWQPVASVTRNQVSQPGRLLLPFSVHPQTMTNKLNSIQIDNCLLCKWKNLPPLTDTKAINH